VSTVVDNGLDGTRCCGLLEDEKLVLCILVEYSTKGVLGFQVYEIQEKLMCSLCTKIPISFSPHKRHM
jgi:hypothetical protein